MTKNLQPEKRDFQSSYIPLDVSQSVNEYDDGVQGGETCHVTEIETIFAWMRGFVYGWYGWANDGKGTFLDFLMVLKSKKANWKWAVYKGEDMDSSKRVVDKNGKVLKPSKIQANRIYQNLAWTLTGKTWSKELSEKYKWPRMTIDEQMEALDFITKHFFVIYPPDRHYKNILDDFKFLYEKHGIDGFLIDPWNLVKLDNIDRGDERLVNAFIDVKQFALETNTSFNIINHPRADGANHKEGKGKDAPFKVVNQFMQLGGNAWDMKMDGQFSIYRPERHLKPSDPHVKLFNLKIRQAEIVDAERGEWGERSEGQKIVFSKRRKQYYFNGICPIDGSMTEEREREESQKAGVPFDRNSAFTLDLKVDTTEKQSPFEAPPVPGDDETPF